MSVLNKLGRFAKAEDGAITVDWVVLTAAICGLCIAAYTGIENETVALSSDVAATIENEDVTGQTASAASGTSGGD